MNSAAVLKQTGLCIGVQVRSEICLPGQGKCLTRLEVSDPVLIAASGSVIPEGEVRQIALPQVWPVDLLEDLQQCGSRGLQCGTGAGRSCGDGQSLS